MWVPYVARKAATTCSETLSSQTAQHFRSWNEISSEAWGGPKKWGEVGIQTLQMVVRQTRQYESWQDSKAKGWHWAVTCPICLVDACLPHRLSKHQHGFPALPIKPHHSCSICPLPRQAEVYPRPWSPWGEALFRDHQFGCLYSLTEINASRKWKSWYDWPGRTQRIRQGPLQYISESLSFDYASFQHL